MKFLREFPSKIKYDEYVALSGNPWPTISTFENEGQRTIDVDEKFKDADVIMEFEKNASKYLGGNGDTTQEASIRTNTKSIYGNDRHYGCYFDTAHLASGNTVPPSRFGIWEQYSFYQREKDKFDSNLIAYKFNKVGTLNMVPDSTFGWLSSVYPFKNIKMREGLTKVGQYTLRNDYYRCNLIFPDTVTTFGGYTVARDNSFPVDACIVWGTGIKNFGTAFFDRTPIPTVYYVCKATTPPTGSSPFGSYTFSSRANEKYKYIFVPREALETYQTRTNAFTSSVGSGKAFLGFKSIEDDLPSTVNIYQTWMPDGALPR